MAQPALKSYQAWTAAEHRHIVETLLKIPGVKYFIGREEYTLLTSVKETDQLREDLNDPKTELVIDHSDKINNSDGVNSDYPRGKAEITPTLSVASSKKLQARKPFLLPFDIQQNKSIGSGIESFKCVRSDALCVNIGLDTEFEDPDRSYDDDDKAIVETRNRRVLSIQATVDVGSMLYGFFFLIDPRYQSVTKDGGLIPLGLVIADILEGLRQHFKNLPRIHRSKLVKKEGLFDGKKITYVDYHAKEMKEVTIPVTIVCHTGKADLSVFRRTKYDIKMIPKLAEIQGGWCSTEHCYYSVSPDGHGNYCYNVDLSVRDTLSLTPAENKSLKSLAKVINREKITLPDNAIEHMASFALEDPVSYYEYAMNDADLVVEFCSSLFGNNRKLPMTLSSAAASSMMLYMKKFFNVKSKAEFDRIFRGLELLDEGVIANNDNPFRLRFLKATRYVPINDDARWFSTYSAEAYTGGFNASFFLGWIEVKTTDFDLKNAYPTAMANVIDVDWEKALRDLPREYELTLQDVVSPLIPFVAYIDFEFPPDCYCPCIPVPANGLKIYPRKGRNVYACGPDIYLALKLGACVKCHRGFVAQMASNSSGGPSRSLAYAVSLLVRDRAIAKREYPDDPLVEKTLKTMVNSCYGKTAQNVSPKTEYNARKMGRVDSAPSAVTSPYHACYITALVRDMLIANINQLHDLGYRVYSVTTDGFITDAPESVLVNLDAYGFYNIFQEGRYRLSGNRENSNDNHVWEAKHINDAFLNITTRGNVAVNDEGVLAHNSYTTGEIKDSRADRDAYLIAVLTRAGRLKCKTKRWTEFAEIVERKHDFHVTEIIRELSMNFDYKRCPILETAIDRTVHYEPIGGGDAVDAVIAEFDTRPFEDREEYMNYRKVMKHEDSVKVVADLKRVHDKATIDSPGYLGSDPEWAILRSVIMGYRCKVYSIPCLDGLKGKELLSKINSFGISTRAFTSDDWKNCGRDSYQSKMLSFEYVEEALAKIGGSIKQYEITEMQAKEVVV